MNGNSEYEKSYSRIARDRLVIPRTKEGALDLTFYDVAKTVNQELEPIPGYVGLAPVGSRTRGYADKDSDFDIIIFYDGTQSDNDRKELQSEVSKTAAALEKTEHVRIDAVGNITHLTPYMILSDLTLLSRGQRVNKVRLGFLFAQTAIGRRMDEYKQKVVATLQNFPEQSRDVVIRALAEATVEQEKAYEHKLKDRLRDLSQDELSSMWDERRKAWEKQISEAVRLYS